MTFKDLCIEDSARFDVNLKKRASLDEIIQDIININPNILENELFELFMEYRPRTDRNKPWYINTDLDLMECGIKYLPDSFGDLVIDGNLLLGFNELTSLPNWFGYLTIGGNLHINDGILTSLTESLVNLTVGGDLGLDDNKLTSLPDSFGNLTVSGDLHLQK